MSKNKNKHVERPQQPAQSNEPLLKKEDLRPTVEEQIKEVQSSKNYKVNLFNEALVREWSKASQKQRKLWIWASKEEDFDTLVKQFDNIFNTRLYDEINRQ